MSESFLPALATYLTTIGSTGTSWVYINGGSANKLAIRNDGKLFAWGSNGYGQLGINSTNDRSSPVQIVPLKQAIPPPLIVATSLPPLLFCPAE